MPMAARAGWTRSTRSCITDAVYAKCDDLDGVKDGIISNVDACNAAFDVKTLRCPNGADRRHLPVGRAAAARSRSSRRTTSRASTIAGMDTFPKWALLEGALFAERVQLRPGAAAVRIRCRAKSRCSTAPATRR